MTEKYVVRFYVDGRGKAPVQEYLEKLRTAKNNNDRKLFEKIMAYLKALQVAGNSLGEPYVKHVRNTIWELRPRRERIFYVTIMKNQIYLLHHFTKKTRQTPTDELNVALRRYKALLGGNKNEK